MALVVSLTGMVIAVMSLFGAARPAWLVAVLSIWRGPTRFGIAVVVRLVLGVLFILASPDCRWPALVRVVGVVEHVGLAAVARPSGQLVVDLVHSDESGLPALRVDEHHLSIAC